MSSSSVSPDDSRGIRNTFGGLRRRIVLAFNRHYQSAALGVNLYGSRVVLPLWAAMLLFTIVSELLPGDSAPMMALSVTHVNDKVLHFSAYAVVTFIPVFGLRLSTAMGCIITTELVGIGLEFTQLFVRQRSCDPYDMAANTAGVIAGFMIAIAGRTRFIRTDRPLSDD